MKHSSLNLGVPAYLAALILVGCNSAAQGGDAPSAVGGSSNDSKGGSSAGGSSATGGSSSTSTTKNASGGAFGSGGSDAAGGAADSGGSVGSSNKPTSSAAPAAGGKIVTGAGGKVGNGGAISLGGAGSKGGSVSAGGKVDSSSEPGASGTPVTAVAGRPGVVIGNAGRGPVNPPASGSGAVAKGGAPATGGAAPSAAGSSSVATPGGNNSVAYIGCSMAYNIGTGYKRVGGKVMWNADSYQTSAMVVQNWTDTNSSSWKLFDQKMQSIGGKDKVTAIMVQICIFSSRATDDEIKSMIKAARAHTNPGTHIYLVGQPQYEAGHECTLAGTGGAQWTDEEAKKIAADTSIDQDVSYLGKFMLDSTKNEVMSDSCHASSPMGEDALGKQAMKFFGG